MDLADAMQIVLDLARENQISDREAQADPSLHNERKRQQEALDNVEDFAVNQLGDD